MRIGSALLTAACILSGIVVIEANPSITPLTTTPKPAPVKAAIFQLATK